MRTLAFVTLTLFAACSKPNPYYCESNPDHNCLLDGDVNAPQGCQNNAQCTNGAKPVCDLADKVCVACTADNIGSCSGTTPVCAANNTCTPCASHNECSSAVCLADGACANEPDVAYVDATGTDGNGCTKAQPCKTIAAAIATNRTTVKLRGNLDEAAVVTSGTVHFYAEPGATLRRTASNGPVLEVRGAGTTVTVSGLTLRDATGTMGWGIYVPSFENVDLTLDRVLVLNNAGLGLNVLGGKLTMTRSVVSGNSLGGAVISAVFDVSNSLFVSNGGSLSSTGGVTLSPPVAGVSFKFNTVANNLSSAGTATVRGINCTVPMTASNTIVSGNAASSNCTFAYSLFDTGTTVTGTNIAGDPMFKSIDALSPTTADYFHIAPTSAAVDHADPVSTMATDIDGDARPMGSAPDIGADEQM